MVLNIFFIAGLAVFTAAYILQVISIKHHNDKMRKITKPFIVAGILLSLVMALIFRLPDSRNILIWTSLSLCASFTGDILLIDTNTMKRVIPGGLSFIISNLAYVILLSPSLKLFPMPVFVTILSVLVYAGVFAVFYLFIVHRPGLKATALLLFYFLFEIMLHYESMISFFGSPKFYSSCFGIGIALLIASDMILARRLFKVSGPNNRLHVMIIYPFSQLFLAAGALLMSYNL